MEIVHTGLFVRLAMPYIAVMLVHVMHVTDGVGIEHIECQVNHRITTRLVERIVVIAALGQRTVTERVTATLTDGLPNIRVGDVLDGQVEDMLYAVITCLVLDGLEVTS